MPLLVIFFFLVTDKSECYVTNLYLYQLFNYEKIDIPENIARWIKFNYVHAARFSPDICFLLFFMNKGCNYISLIKTQMLRVNYYKKKFLKRNYDRCVPEIIKKKRKKKKKLRLKLS